MSGRIEIGFVDLAAFSFGYDRVRCDLMRSFLVRNGCGSYGRVSPQIAFALDPEVANFAAADFDSAIRSSIPPALARHSSVRAVFPDARKPANSEFRAFASGLRTPTLPFPVAERTQSMSRKAWPL